MIEEVFNKIVEQAKESAEVDDQDYIGEDGLLYCHKCNTRKQYKLFIPFYGCEKVLPVACKCRLEQVEQDEKEEKRREFAKKVERLRRDGITDERYLSWTFAADDKQNAKVSEMARRYCDKWPEMREKNIGLMFYGDVDGGKSFMAAAIANELIEHGVSVLMSSMADLVRGITPFEDKVSDAIMNADLLIIDEVGRVRETPMAVENMQKIIDTRYRAKKPLIITTNLSLEYMRNVDDDQYKALFSRLKEICIPVFVEQKNRREQKGKEKRDEMARILGF